MANYGRFMLSALLNSYFSNPDPHLLNPIQKKSGKPEGMPDLSYLKKL